MPRSQRKHLKRLDAPHGWMLDKLGGVYAPRPTAGPHKLRECMPLMIILRNKLKFALDGRECLSICMNKHVRVDGKVRTSPHFPAGFRDVVSLPKAKLSFRLLYDTKGRFMLQPIADAKEAEFKLCKVVAKYVGERKVPTVTTHDGRTIRYPDPLVKVGDSVKIDLATGKMTELVSYEVGALVMIVKGRNTGRVGVIVHRERHDAMEDIVRVKDANGHMFATRLSSLFLIGPGEGKSLISLPHSRGIKRTILEEQQARERKAQNSKRR